MLLCLVSVGDVGGVIMVFSFAHLASPFQLVLPMFWKGAPKRHSRVFGEHSTDLGAALSRGLSFSEKPSNPTQ